MHDYDYACRYNNLVSNTPVNLSGAFIVPEERKIDLNGRRVLLIDDVYTTGTTAKATTRALLRGGASHVDVLVFAKVETEFD